AQPTQGELCSYYGTDDKEIYNFNHHFDFYWDASGTSACYAMSVADLLTEDKYLRLIGTVSNQEATNKISVIDIQRCDMEAGHGLGYPNFAELSAFSMECALYKEGACLEKQAMFNIIMPSNAEALTDKLRYYKFQEFMNIYDGWKKWKVLGHSDSSYFEAAAGVFWQYLPKTDGYSYQHFKSSFYLAKNRVHFLNLLLTTDNCAEKRYTFENRGLFWKNYYKDNYYSFIPFKKEKMAIIKKAFSLKRSSMLALYLETDNGSSLIHSAVVTAMRMSGGKCQLYLRSSTEPYAAEYTNGKGWFSNWYDADTILESTLSIKYLKEVSAEDYETAKALFLKKDINKSYIIDKLYTDPETY
ncbi:MAG: hypothetical protein WCQ53_02535, partial [bacterium]